MCSEPEQFPHYIDEAELRGHHQWTQTALRMRQTYSHCVHMEKHLCHVIYLSGQIRICPLLEYRIGALAVVADDGVHQSGGAVL